jgi:hypothetical protein
MRTTAIRSLRLVLVAFIPAGQVVGAESDDYLPVALNAEWVMDVTFQSPTGAISKGVARRKMEEIVVRDGKTYHRSRSTLEGGGFPGQDYTKLVRKDAMGFHSIDLRPAATLRLRSPCLCIRIRATTINVPGDLILRCKSPGMIDKELAKERRLIT